MEYFSSFKYLQKSLKYQLQEFFSTNFTDENAHMNFGLKKSQNNMEKQQNYLVEKKYNKINWTNYNGKERVIIYI